jgi:phosphodiesterase/alkaline phosphatase D-like protein
MLAHCGAQQQKGPAAVRENAKGSLDRRDFLIASLATVGAAAAFAATAEAAKAQDTAASPQPTATVYTGDLIHGKKVISALDVKDLDRPTQVPVTLRVARFNRRLTYPQIGIV